MAFATFLGGIAILLWLGFAGYVIYGLIQGTVKGKTKAISVSTVVVLLVLALLATTLSSSIVVVGAGEVGVVFNAFSGTKETPLYPGMHVVIPYVNEVYRYSTREQIYTMALASAEGEILGDDSLWSPTIEGLQIGIDSSTRYALDPRKVAYVHNNLRDTYVQVLIRPTIRSVVRHYVSQNSVTDVYGPKRREIQQAIEGDMRARFEDAGFLLLSFDIRNVNFTERYKQAIEQKQIAQQQAEQMQYTLQREEQESERKRVEAKGIKDAVVIKAGGEAEALRLVSEALEQNRDLLTYRYIEKLAPNISVMMVPSDNPFILDLGQVQEQVTP